MKDLFVFATSSTFCTLPPVKQIYSFLHTKYNTLIIESKIETFEDFFLDPSYNYKVNNYKTYSAYAKQSLVKKVSKHIKLLGFFLNIRFNFAHKYKRVYFYSFELYPIFLAILFKPKNFYIIYHQYEMVLPDELNKLDRFYLRYIIKMWKKVDLAIFPEINRINYFKNIINEFRINQFFLMPNSNNNSIINGDTSYSKAKIRVVHIGSLGKDHHILSLLETIKELPEDKFEFYFVGNITKEVHEEISSLHLPNAFIFSQVRHNELHEIYLSADIGLILYGKETLNTTFCAPNKLYEFWSYGIPVIGDKLPGLISVFNDPLQGILVEMDKSNQIMDALIKLSKFNKSNKSELKKIFESQYRLDIYLNKIEKIVKEI